MISWISCPSPVMLQTSHPFHRSHRSVSNVSRFSLREIGLSWPQCVKDLKKRKLSFHPDLSQIMVLQRGSRMFCKNYTWYGWSMGSCLFFPPWVFFCHRGVFLCLLVFIDFAVLLFSLVRWSLIAVVAVSEVHREVSSWWTVGMKQNGLLTVGGWENTLEISIFTSSGDAWNLVVVLISELHMPHLGKHSLNINQMYSLHC